MEAACLATASVNVKTATSHVAEFGSSSRDGSVIMDENNACSKQRVNGLSGVAKVEPLASPALSGPEEYDDDDDDDEDDDDDDEEEDDRDSFDEVSSLQDQFEELDESIFDNDPEACTRQEAQALRLDLRAIGPEAFCAKYLDTEGMTAKKLLTAFCVRPPHVMDGSPDDAYYMLLGAAISRELSKRMKLPQYNTIDDAVALIKQSKNIVVLTGAGISTSLGIPDFRSKDIGLYSKLEHLGLNDPQEVFDIEQFRRDPTIFFSVAKDILPDIDRFTPTHAFIALLQKKGKLLTNYSQNIDNIEAVAGILPEKLIQCHGSFATATCQNCGYKASGETIFRDIKEEVIPRCPMCIKELQRLRAPGMKRKRSYNSQSKKKFQGGQKKYSDSDDESDYDVPEAGIMKPDITFFGEALPDRFGDRLTGHDKERVDLVIVIGTSLKVAPVSEVVPYLPANIPQMYISRTPVAHVNFDIDMLGDCDVVVEELCRRAGWDLNHEMTVPRDTQIEINLVEGYTSRYNFITPPAPDVKLR